MRMKKSFLACLGFTFIIVLLTISVSAQDIPAQVQQKGEDCLTSLLNKDSRALSFYSTKSGVYLNASFHMNAETFIPGIQEILRSCDILKRKPLTYVPHNDTKGMEVGYLIDTKGQKTILYATGWSLQENEWKKDFEYLRALKQPVMTDDLFAIARKRWVNLCNLKDPSALTKEMYLENAIYFSYGELTEGQAEIANRYSYMSRPDYSLDLKGEITVVFDESEGMEVGKYINARNEGVYIILWKKVDKSWRVMLDFNF